MSEGDEIVSIIRATLLSVKGSLSLKQCNHDYLQVQGEHIPYKRLGFTSLRQLFETIPGFCLSEDAKGECLVNVIPSENTRNLAQLVAKQKSTKKPTKLVNSIPRKVSQNAWKPGLSSNMWKFINTTPTKTHSGYHKPQSTSPKKVIPNRYPEPARYNSEPSRYNSEPARYNNESVKYSNEPPKQNNVQTKIVTTEYSTNKQPMKYNNNNIQPSKKISVTINNSKAPSVHLTAADRLNALQTKLQHEKIEPFIPPKVNETKKKISQLSPDKDMKENNTRLLKLCQLMNLPEPVFKVIESGRKGRGPPAFDCMIKIGNQHTFNTYPNSLSTKELANETASSKALTKLQAIALENGSSKTCTKPSIALDRIIKLIASIPYGLWENKLPDLYRSKYKDEILPDDWMELVRASPSINVEEAINGLLILIYTDSKDIPTTPTPPINNSPSVEERQLPPPLQYPEEPFWNVFVMSASSPVEVWLRIVGDKYSHLFENLNTEMDLYYMDRKSPSNNILIGGWYALKWEHGLLRTRILEINLKEQMALCFLVDTGDEESHPLINFYDLPIQFLNLAPQAILCRLGGLEEFSLAGSNVKFDFDILISKVLVAEVLQVPDENLPGDDPSVTVVLYDTTTKQDINLNTVLLQNLTSEAQSPQLSHEVNEIYICDVKPNGEICAQIHNESWNLLQKMLNQVVNGPFPKEALQASSGPLSPVPKSYYLVKSNLGDWVRATLENKQTLPNGETVITAYYVDFGIVEVVSAKNVLLLERLSTAIDSFPVQLLKLTLHNVPQLRDGHFECLKNLLPCNTLALCKQMPRGSNSVEIYVRTPPHNILCSVNYSINLEIEMAKTTMKDMTISDPVSALSEKKGRIFSVPKVAPKEIPKLELPKKGKFFNVYISMAANPSNFIVQSLDMQNKLQEIMEKLQSVNTNPSLTTVPIVGAAYAAYYDQDDYWYRVIVQGMISSNMASIYFCDYGNLQSVEITQLKELPNELKTLPAQAIRAKLYGVSQKSSDWSVDDCIRFQEIVVEKNFVSIVENIEKDPIQKNELLLTLNLIDTSTETDVYINKLLASEGRAKLI